MNKKLCFISCLIILLMAVTAVGAVDSNSTDDMSAEDYLEITDDGKDELTKTVTGNTFEDIQKAVNSAKDGETIELSGYYTGSGKQISVDKALTFMGKNDATLDAKGIEGIMAFQTENIVLKNIKFINSGSTAVESHENCEIINCEFRDCSGWYDGAINGYGTRVADSTFINCTSGGNGAIYGADVENCTFIKCNSHDKGYGVVCSGSVAKSTFIDCYSDFIGDIVAYASCEDCTFINCSSMLYIVEEAKNSLFMSCSGALKGCENCTILSKIDDISRYDVGKYYDGKRSVFIVNANTFEDIQKAIDQASGGDIVLLDGEYTGDEAIIVRSSAITVEGIKATLTSKSRIFDCQSQMTIRNVVFANTKDTAVKLAGEGLIVGSTFNNCYGYDGGAVSGYKNKNSRAINCTFIGCSGEEGGAVNSMDLVSDSTFIGCKAYEGGAIYECEEIAGCSFAECSANYGGAIYSYYADGNIDGCTFRDCKASGGGAVKGCEVVANSTFINCVSTKQGSSAVECGYEYDNVINCTFIDCGSSIKDGTSYYCVFKGTSKPEPSKTVLYRHASISIAQSGTYYRDKTLTVCLTDTDSNVPIYNQSVAISFSNGETATLTTDSKGIATYDIIYAPGKYSAAAALTDTKFDCRSKTLDDISIEKAPANIEVKKLTTPYKGKNTLTIKIINSKTNKPISNVEVTLKVYTGKKYETHSLKTNAKGTVSFSTSALSIATHNVVISSPDKGLSLKTKKTSVVVYKPDVKLASSNDFLKKFSLKGKKITLKDKKTKKPLVNVKVQFKLYTSNKKYQTYTLKTGNDGSCGLFTSKLKEGYYKLVISSKEKNVNFKLTTKIQVEKIKVYDKYCTITLSAGKTKIK